MNVLIVDDSEYKSERVSDFLKSTHKNLNLVIAASYSSGLQELTKQTFDFAIIDMSLPTYDRKVEDPESGFRVYGGLDLARQIKRRKIKSKYIFLTQYNSFTQDTKNLDIIEITTQSKLNYPESFLGCVYYDHAGYDWKDQILKALECL